MEIINKTKDKLDDFTAYINNGGQYYSCVIDIKALTILIHTDNDMKGNKTLLAQIGWDYSTRTREDKNFPYTEDGFDAMCEWLDSMRLKFAAELL